MQPITQAQVKNWSPKRPLTAHKGDFGRVLVVAGSRTMCGAGFLCAKSALTAGAGLVYWALHKSMQPFFAAALPEVITLPMPENASGEIDESAWDLFPEICAHYKPSVLAVGCGMGKSPVLAHLLWEAALPLVADADALNSITRFINDAGMSWPQERPCIFTPHAGEMARLLHAQVVTDIKDRQTQVEQLVKLTGAVALFKGAPTLVSACVRGELQTFQNTTGGPSLAKGGTGDVLTGLIAGLWAQLAGAEGFSVQSALKAAVCGVYLHGLAGDLAAQAKSNFSVLASDIITYLSRAFITVQEGQ